MHWLLARTALRSSGFARFIEGGAVILGQSGGVSEEQLRRHNISATDLHEALRKEGVEDAAHTRRVTLEPSGNITVITAS